ncbi:MAG: ParA family protein [Polyangiaceae bacterium]|nr:ParA family protein [Polyangiaceae bacterium]
MGKTTLACNVASCLALEHKLNVLLVDADPQCNATQLVLPEELTEQIYHTGGSGVDSLNEVLKPLLAGDASPNVGFTPAAADTNRFGVSVLPGHPQIALLEDQLSQGWTNLIGGNLGGARVSNWNTHLLCNIQPKYDLIVYDVGPSLGALNRSVLLGVDFFVAPMGCDIFSLIGIANIAEWLTRWHQQYETGLAQCEQNHGKELWQYAIKKSASEMSRFVGYTVQQYITKTIRNKKRPTSAYEQILEEIPANIQEHLTGMVGGSLRQENLRLGDVPHMYSLVPLAQSARAPIHQLVSGDGLNGGQFSQQDDYKEFITALSTSLLRNLKTARGTAAVTQ